MVVAEKWIFIDPCNIYGWRRRRRATALRRTCNSPADRDNGEVRMGKSQRAMTITTTLGRSIRVECTFLGSCVYGAP